MENSMDLECFGYKKIDTGTFAGFADIFIKNYSIEVYGCTVYKKGDRRWVNLPIRTFKTPDGEEKYAPVLRFREPKDFRDFCECAKRAIDIYTNTQGQIIDGLEDN
jgi:hypothetical protein